MSQATLNRCDGGKVTLVHRLKYALTLVTIEPMVLVQGVADYIAEVPEAQMVLYKTCRGKQRTVWTNGQIMEHCIVERVGLTRQRSSAPTSRLTRTPPCTVR